MRQDNLLKQLDEKQSKADICKLKDQRPWFRVNSWMSNDYLMLTYLVIINHLGAILPERLPEGNYKDLLNLVEASYGIKGSDWERALVSCIVLWLPTNKQLVLFNDFNRNAK